MRDGKIVLAEVGCGPLSMTFASIYWHDDNALFDLFEPHPVYAAAIREASKDRPNVKLHEVAIGDEAGKLNLYDEGTSSSLAGVASPSQQHKGDHERKTYEVEVRRFSDFDKGDIDHLRLDTEGNEWACLKHLVSRPEQIVVEMYNDLASYINPHFYDICQWAEQNGYKLGTIHDSDFIFVRQTVEKPLFHAFTPMHPPVNLSIEQCEAAVRRLIIANYTNLYLGTMDPTEFVVTLRRIFQRKEKVLHNLAVYVQKEAAAGHPADKVLNSLGFYARILKEFAIKVTNQPLRQP